MRIDVNHGARAEDLAWMARWGETPHGAAERLGISRDALEKWCERQERGDLWRRLVANERGAA